MKTRLLPLAKNMRKIDWFRLFYFHNYLKRVNICQRDISERHYEWNWINEIECSAKEKIIFHSQSERDAHVCPYYYQFTPSPLYAHSRPLTLYMMYFFPYHRNLNVIKYTKLATFYSRTSMIELFRAFSIKKLNRYIFSQISFIVDVRLGFKYDSAFSDEFS